MSCSEEEIDKIPKRELKSSALHAGKEPAVHSPRGALGREPWARLSKERSHQDDIRPFVEAVPSFQWASLQHQPPPGGFASFQSRHCESGEVVCCPGAAVTKDHKPGA